MGVGWSQARLDTVLAESFARNETFGYAAKDAFEHFINLRANRPAELIAKFIDAKLRPGNKGTSEEELEAILDRVLTLFRYIQVGLHTHIRRCRANLKKKAGLAHMLGREKIWLNR